MKDKCATFLPDRSCTGRLLATLSTPSQVHFLMLTVSYSTSMSPEVADNVAVGRIGRSFAAATASAVGSKDRSSASGGPHRPLLISYVQIPYVFRKSKAIPVGQGACAPCPNCPLYQSVAQLCRCVVGQIAARSAFDTRTWFARRQVKITRA
jgi:hypothetical protein